LITGDDFFWSMTSCAAITFTVSRVGATIASASRGFGAAGFGWLRAGAGSMAMTLPSTTVYPRPVPASSASSACLTVAPRGTAPAMRASPPAEYRNCPPEPRDSCSSARANGCAAIGVDTRASRPSAPAAKASGTLQGDRARMIDR